MSVLQGTVYTAQLVAGQDLTGTSVSATVTAPDGTTVTSAASVAGSTASLPIQAMQVGTYLIVWVASGALSGGQQDQFTVVRPRIDLISLPDLKDRLHITAADSSKDEQLRAWVRSANDVVENVTGPIRPNPRTETFNGGGPAVLLAERWVSAVTVVTETAGNVSRTLTEQPLGVGVPDGYGYTWDRNLNMIVRRSYGSPWNFQGGLGAVSVTYTAGLTTIPDDIQLATAELIRHWYQKSQPVRAAPFGGAQGDDAFQPGNYLLPNAVMEILEPWRRPPEVG